MSNIKDKVWHVILKANQNNLTIGLESLSASHSSWRFPGRTSDVLLLFFEHRSREHNRRIDILSTISSFFYRTFWSTDQSWSIYRSWSNLIPTIEFITIYDLIIIRFISQLKTFSGLPNKATLLDLSPYLNLVNQTQSVYWSLGLVNELAWVFFNPSEVRFTSGLV